MDEKEKSFLDRITSPLTGDYRKKKPISVKAADVAVGMTPVGSAVEIGEELSKEDPSYAKIGVIAAGDVLGAAIPAAGPVAKSLIKQSDNIESVWSYPKQLYDSADTSINVSKKPAGYNELKKRGEIKDGDVIVDIGGGRFDNLVEDAAEEGATVKVYDPFNRTPEHNAAVVDSVKDGQADMAMSHNVLNVIQEDKNIIDIAVQAENAIKPNGKAHFSVYEGTGKGEGKVTTKGYQRNQKTEAYVPLIEEVFGKGNVTRKGKIITATKNVQGYSEGGMALEEQMNMNFGDVPDNTIGIDPVSGNEIPLGSTAENVRDDIPAQLSEGEYVVPADVVRFYGVKFFEDLRAEAKMGYNMMAQNGRIGGEPVEDEDDIGLDLSDLEIVDVQEMNTGGLPKKRYTFDEIKQRMIEKKDEPVFKNNFEKIMYNLFGNDRKDTPPPKRAVDKPPIDFGFGGNPMERASRKYGSKPTPTQNERMRERLQTGPTERARPIPTRGKTLAEQMNFPGFDEGGDSSPRVVLEGKTGQMLPDDYDPAVDSIGGGVMEMRAYQNAEGHTLMIPFLNGVPQTVIPDGYFPVGSAPVVTPVQSTQSSRDNDDPGGDFVAPEPFNYNELSIDQLAEEVQNLQETPTFLGTGLFSGIIAIAQKRHRNKLIQEIDRRLSNESFNNPNAEVFGPERSYLENLKEVAEAPPKKGMIGKFLDKLTGEETEEPDLPNLTGPTYDELPSIKEVGDAQVSEPYSPDPTELDKTSDRGYTPDNIANPASTAATVKPRGVDTDRGYVPENVAKAAARADAPPSSARQDLEDLARELTTPQVRGNTRLEKDGQRRRDRQESNKNLQGKSTARKTGEARSTTRGLSTSDKEGGAELDSRFGITGLNEGGLMGEKQVKEVVKGLKKASKLHAKQADTLEKTMKAKKKKSK